jgi:hypothetical protein
LSIETIEFTFPAGYAANRLVTIEIEALVKGQVVAKVGRTLPLEVTCTALSLSLESVAMAMSGPDMTLSGPDMALSGPDMTPSGPDMALSGPDMALSGPATWSSVPVTISAGAGVGLSRGSVAGQMSFSVGLPVAGVASGGGHSIELGLLHNSESK